MTRALASGVILLVAATPAWALVVDAGSFRLLPDTVAAIQVYVSGGEVVDSVDFAFQVEEQPVDPQGNLYLGGPTIQSVDLLSATIFDGKNNGQGSGTTNWQAWASTTAIEGIDPPVSAEGLLATVELNTAGLSVGTTWHLKLVMDLDQDQDNVKDIDFPTYFTGPDPLTVTLNPGTVEVVGSPTLKRGDFDLNDNTNSADVPGFAWALRDELDYLTDHPALGQGDLLPLGNYTEDGAFDDADARQFADDAATHVSTGLPTRTARYVALDQAYADAAGSWGHVDGNFFSTTLATGKTYQFGDSRGDLTGTDLAIDAADIDYLVAHLGDDGRTELDLNDDGLVNGDDQDVLIGDILGTFYGDANLDGFVDAADLAVFRQHVGSSGGWADANFNDDAFIDAADLALFRQYVGSSAPIPPSSPKEAVPEPHALALLAVLLGMLAVSPRLRVFLRGR